MILKLKRSEIFPSYIVLFWVLYSSDEDNYAKNIPTKIYLGNVLQLKGLLK